MNKKDMCKCENYCSCEDFAKSQYCKNCYWYWFVDSGYGYCKALPEVSMVPWCKDGCSLYKERIKNVG